MRKSLAESSRMLWTMYCLGAALSVGSSTCLAKDLAVDEGSLASKAKVSTVASLTQETGFHTFQGLMFADNGSFYGTAVEGGAFGRGTIFQVKPSRSVKALHDFTSSEGQDHSIPTQGSDGALYGFSGQYQFCGILYRLSLAGDFSVLHQLASDGSEGCYSSRFAQAPDGFLYDTSWYGSGVIPAQVLRRISPAGDFAVVADFGTTGFKTPSAPLVGDDGNLYLTLVNSGAQGDGFGAVARVSPQGKIKILYEFQGTEIDGGFPVTPLVYDGAHAYMYGMTYTTIFRYRDGIVETIATPCEGEGLGPFALGPDGVHFYGMFGHKIRSLALDGTIQTIARIPDKVRQETLSFSAAGAMFGTTYDGGVEDVGTVFKVKGF